MNTHAPIVWIVALAAIHTATFVLAWRSIRRGWRAEQARGLEWTGPAR